MTANVSEPASSGGGGPRLKTGTLLQPPAKPISTLQHNYSNIKQPSPMIAAAISEPFLSRNGLSASTLRPSGPNSLAGGTPNTASSFPQLGVNPAAYVSNGSSAELVLPPGAQHGGAFSRGAVRPRTPTDESRGQRRRERIPVADDLKKNNLGNLDDLIHLEPPLNEDTVIRALQARFFNQKYYVSYLLQRLLKIFIFTVNNS